MSTFLDLCGDVARESGGVAAAPTAVTGQTGRQNKIVEWVGAAWEDIQQAHADWLFRRAAFSGTLASGTKRYTGAALGIADLADWVTDYSGHEAVSIYPVGSQSKESALGHVSYERWRRSYDFGTHDNAKPTVYAISPANELCVGATPDASYTIRGEYWKTPQVLTANADVPIMPERFHPAILWKAIMLMSQHDSAWDAYNAAELRYEAIRRNMERDLLPAITTGGNALA